MAYGLQINGVVQGASSTIAQQVFNENMYIDRGNINPNYANILKNNVVNYSKYTNLSDVTLDNLEYDPNATKPYDLRLWIRDKRTTNPVNFSQIPNTDVRFEAGLQYEGYYVNFDRSFNARYRILLVGKAKRQPYGCTIDGEDINKYSVNYTFDNISNVWAPKNNIVKFNREFGAYDFIAFKNLPNNFDVIKIKLDKDGSVRYLYGIEGSTRIYNSNWNGNKVIRYENFRHINNTLNLGMYRWSATYGNNPSYGISFDGVKVNTPQRTIYKFSDNDRTMDYLPNKELLVMFPSSELIYSGYGLNEEYWGEYTSITLRKIGNKVEVIFALRSNEEGGNGYAIDGNTFILYENETMASTGILLAYI